MKIFHNYTLYKVVLNTEFEKYLETVNNLIKDYLKEILQNKKKGKDEEKVEKKDKKIEYFEIGEFNHQLLDILKLKVYDSFKTISQDFIFFNIHSGYVLSNKENLSINKISILIQKDFFNIIKNLIKNEINIDISNYPILHSIIQSYKFNYIYELESVINNIVCLPVSSCLSGYEEMILIKDDIILNDAFVKIESKVISNYKCSILFKDEEFQGFCLNKVYWYFDFEDIKDYVLHDTLLKWLLLKIYLTKKNKESKDKEKKYSGIKSDFVKKFRDKNFTQLLTDLINGYYLTDDCIPKKYQIYFEDNQLFTNIKKDKYRKKTFVVRLSDNGTALGIYDEENTGNKPNNLEYWISLDKESINHFPNKSEYEPERVVVKTLKPEYSFYLMECFGEDFTEEVLKQLKQKSKIKDYIRNVDFRENIDEKTNEIDFFILSKKDKICKIEVKKTLDKRDIDSQKCKDEVLYNNDIYKIISEYYLIGFKGDTKIIDTYHYFINSDKDNNNLDFEVPLFNTKEKLSLNCITANNFEALYNKLSEKF